MSEDTTTIPPESPLPPSPDAREETRKDVRAGVVLALLCAAMLLGGWVVLLWSKR